MKKVNYRKKTGFTIIEVSLVLAIAGLILVMAFIAFPALQRSQRDAQRKSDVLTFVEAIKKYQENNRGALPKDTTLADGHCLVDDIACGKVWRDFVTKYIGDNFSDPIGGTYQFYADKCDNGCEFLEDSWPLIEIYIQATCDGSEVKRSSNSRNLAVRLELEGGGRFCANT